VGFTAVDWLKFTVQIHHTLSVNNYLSSQLFL
jgi:hypothetical protein